jgi:hypothetical protein
MKGKNNEKHQEQELEKQIKPPEYEDPKIVSEEVFERNALGCCKSSGGCESARIST